MVMRVLTVGGHRGALVVRDGRGGGVGITQGNVGSMLYAPNPEAAAISGAEGDFGKGSGSIRTGLPDLKRVGDYGESFERNVAMLPPRHCAGPHGSWKNGGLQYAPRIR